METITTNINLLKAKRDALLNARATSASNERYLQIVTEIGQLEHLREEGAALPTLFRARQVRRFSSSFGGRFAVAA